MRPVHPNGPHSLIIFYNAFLPLYSIMHRKALFFLFLLSGLSVSAQKKRPPIIDTLRNVTLDSVMVLAKSGLSQDDFIKKMLADTGFYQAFRNMSHYSFTAENRISTYDKKGLRMGKIYRKIYHNNNGPYKAEIIATKDSGKVYAKGGDFDLFTVRMFSYIFMNDKNTDFTDQAAAKGEKGAEGYKDKLKTLIFTPGKPVDGVPLVGHKTELFSDKLRKYYNYSYHHATYQDSIPVYKFRCVMKPELRKSKQDDVMIKEMTTIFDKRNLTILGRYIDMSYSSSLFDFDVKMYIELGAVGEELLPVRIDYNGQWDIPFKESEKCRFDIRHYGYKKK